MADHDLSRYRIMASYILPLNRTVTAKWRNECSPSYLVADLSNNWLRWDKPDEDRWMYIKIRLVSMINR